MQVIATPTVPIAQDLYSLSVRCPDCETHTIFGSLRTKHFPETAVCALVEQMKVNVARHGLDKSGMDHP
jgi:hypothetical protein